jgi:hypothetical protein
MQKSEKYFVAKKAGRLTRLKETNAKPELSTARLLHRLTTD